MPNGDGGGGFDFGGILDPLLGVLGAIISEIIAFLNALVQALVNVLNFLYSGEIGIFNFSLDGLRNVWKGLKNLMDQIFKVWVLGALKHLLALIQKLQKWARKLKVWLDRLRKLQQQQMQAFKRIINLIQRIRQVLVVLKLFHVKWATKLDNWLANIEGKLIRHELEIIAKTNEIVSWLNLILDPIHGLSHLPVFLAAGKSLNAILTLLTGHGINMWYSKVITGGAALPPPITYKQHYDALTTDLRTGAGEVGPWRQTFTDALAQSKALRG
jgi:hypothetical protein